MKLITINENQIEAFVNEHSFQVQHQSVDHNVKYSLADAKLKKAAINPIAYGKTRNYLNGGVTQCSPYISAGIFSISVKSLYLSSFESVSLKRLPDLSLYALDHVFKG
ncbi:MAG: hypothetical protein EOM23_07600 [Candidatus Moranbacteria bacterium]|nr:hypothetical protein [Candidatus Moranbacteria bacterium]